MSKGRKRSGPRMSGAKFPEPLSNRRPVPRARPVAAPRAEETAAPSPSRTFPVARSSRGAAAAPADDAVAVGYGRDDDAVALANGGRVLPAWAKDGGR